MRLTLFFGTSYDPHIVRDWYLCDALDVRLVKPLPFSNPAIAQLVKNFF